MRLEKEIIHNVEKCFDKNAKIHFTLKMSKVQHDPIEKKSQKKEINEIKKLRNEKKQDESDELEELF